MSVLTDLWQHGRGWVWEYCFQPRASTVAQLNVGSSQSFSHLRWNTHPPLPSLSHLGNSLNCPFHIKEVNSWVQDWWITQPKNPEWPWQVFRTSYIQDHHACIVGVRMSPQSKGCVVCLHFVSAEPVIPELWDHLGERWSGTWHWGNIMCFQMIVVHVFPSNCVLPLLLFEPCTVTR